MVPREKVGTQHCWMDYSLVIRQPGLPELRFAFLILSSGALVCLQHFILQFENGNDLPISENDVIS